MNCSKVPKVPVDLPFVVYTNSRDDYGITVRSQGACMPQTEHFLDIIARHCGKLLTSGAGTIVGVVPSPDKSGLDVVFRVFDVGTYQSRPHNLGIVAIEIPAVRHRGWRVAPLLAGLPAPDAGSNSYAIPDIAGIEELDHGEPFASLDEWEQKRIRNGARTGNAVCFSTIPAVEIPVAELLKQVIPRRAVRTVPLVFLVTLIVLLAAVIFWRNWDGLQNPERVPSRYSREELLSVLSESGIALEPDIDFSRAANGIASSASALARRLRELATALEKRSSLPAGDSALELERHRQHWKSPIRLEPAQVAGIDDQALADALKIHRRYQECIHLLDLLSKRSPDGEDFARGLNELRRLLGIRNGNQTFP